MLRVSPRRGTEMRRSLLALTFAGAFGPAATAAAAPPACTHQDVIDVVRDSFDTVQEYELNSPRRLRAIENAKDEGVLQHAPVMGYDVSRYCQGRAKLDNGETVDVWYRVMAKRTDPDGEFGGVRPCFSKYNPPHIRDCSKDMATDRRR
jgi:hypothetical protein